MLHSSAKIMSDSNTEEELAENKRAALEALNSKSSDWTAKFLAGLRDVPTSSEQKMRLAEGSTESMTLMGRRVISQIELAAEDCF